jgi:excisionase family DNA binding protein
VGEDRDTAQDRVTIQEAARRLGVKEDAIRKRIQRGSLRHEKTPEGRVFVWVDAAQDTYQGAAEDEYQDKYRDALLAAKDETIAALREQLEQANERDRENRRIIAALTSRIPELEPPSSQEPSESPVTDVSPDPRERPFTDEERAQEAALAKATQGAPKGTPRAWWRRVFG